MIPQLNKHYHNSSIDEGLLQRVGEVLLTFRACRVEVVQHPRLRDPVGWRPQVEVGVVHELWLQHRLRNVVGLPHELVLRPVEQEGWLPGDRRHEIVTRNLERPVLLLVVAHVQMVGPFQHEGAQVDCVVILLPHQLRCLLVARVWPLLMHQDVVLEETAFEAHSSLVQLAFAVLAALLPGPLVIAAINPVHLAVTVPQVVQEGAPVRVSGWPTEHAFSVLLIVLVLSFVAVELPLLLTPLDPLTLTMSVTTLKLTTVLVAVLP